MRLLYVFQHPRRATSGLSIYDKRLSSALEELGCELHRVPLAEAPAKVGYLGIARGLPPAISRYQTAANSATVKNAIQKFAPDRIILSHESTLFLVEQGIVPRKITRLLCHNMMAHAYRSRHTFVDMFYATLFDRYERRLTSAGVPITAISTYDSDYAMKAYGTQMITQCPPGVLPETVAIANDAGFERFVTISGNYDWRLKRQDITKFFSEALETGLAQQAEIFLSEGASRYAPPEISYVSGMPTRGPLSLGLIVDRFEAGFKLKALEYISSGMALVSYCDLFREFSSAPYAQSFVKRIDHAREIPAILNELESMPDRTIRFRTFQQSLIERYQWHKSAAALLQGG